MSFLTPADRIRNLLGEYCERIDAGDFAGVGELFAQGGLAAGDDGPPFVSGADAVAAFYEAGTQLHDGSPRTKHLVLDTVVEDPDGDGTVVARSSYVVLQAVEGFALQPIITGRYVDRVAPDDPAHPAGAPWHFVERRFLVDLMGDLSHHLASGREEQARARGSGPWNDGSR